MFLLLTVKWEFLLTSLSCINKSELTLKLKRLKDILSLIINLLFESTEIFDMPFLKSIDQMYSVSMKSSIIPPKYMTSTLNSLPTKKCQFVSFLMNCKGLHKELFGNVLVEMIYFWVVLTFYSVLFLSPVHEKDFILERTLDVLISDYDSFVGDLNFILIGQMKLQTIRCELLFFLMQ